MEVGREAAVTLLTDTLAVEITCLDADAVVKGNNGCTCLSAKENGLENGAEVCCGFAAQGSAEALRDAAVLLSTETVAVRVASLGVGPVTQADIASAKAFGARIVAFNVAFETAAVSTRAKQINVPVLCQPVIYRLIEARSLLLSGSCYC